MIYQFCCTESMMLECGLRDEAFHKIFGHLLAGKSLNLEPFAKFLLAIILIENKISAMLQCQKANTVLTEAIVL